MDAAAAPSPPPSSPGAHRESNDGPLAPSPRLSGGGTGGGGGGPVVIARDDAVEELGEGLGHDFSQDEGAHAVHLGWEVLCVVGG